MAEEINIPILGIESLKEYKEYLDSLKVELLKLSEGTEAYTSKSKELRDGQDKLNKVMDIAKGKGEAVEGSYDYLTKTMSKLKREWKATGDEVKRQQLGEEILNINNQLKELDASTGDFHRSVGDYSNAFEKAFEKTLGGLSKMDGEIGVLAGDINNLIPVIKAANTTAVKGLTGVKKAIVATGIGALIIAVGLLVTHWKEFMAFIGVSEEQLDGVKTKALNVFRDIIAGAFGVGNALFQFLITPAKTLITVWTGIGDIIHKIFTGRFDEIKTSVKDTIGSIKDGLKSGFNVEENFKVGQEVGNKFIAGFESRIEIAKEAGKKTGEAVVNGIKEVLDKELEEALSIIERLEKAKKTEYDILKAVYEREKALLEKYQFDTKDLTEKYYKDLAELDEKYRKLREKNRIVLTPGLDLNSTNDYANLEKEVKKRNAILEKQKSWVEVLYNDWNKPEIVKARETSELYINKSINALNDIGNLVASITDLKLEQIDADLKAGKITEQQARQQFEKQKKLQIANTYINMASGVAGAVAQAFSHADPITGAILAAVNSAAVIAAGLAQIKAIKSQNPYSDSGNISTPNLSSLVNEVQPTYTQNLTGQSELTQLANALNERPMYVSVTDINEVQNRVKVVDKETTW